MNDDPALRPTPRHISDFEAEKAVAQHTDEDFIRIAGPDVELVPIDDPSYPVAHSIARDRSGFVDRLSAPARLLRDFGLAIISASYPITQPTKVQPPERSIAASHKHLRRIK